MRFNKKVEDVDKKKPLIRSLVDVPVEGIGNSYSVIGKKLKQLSPQNKKTFQTSLEGFRTPGRNRFQKSFFVMRDFLLFILKYSRRKVFSLLNMLRRVVFGTIAGGANFKAWLVKKLIWSRGKLGRPIATAIVTSAAFAVFLFGEVFNSSTLVNSQEINPDYLSNISDIIPRKSVALTTIPDSRKQSEAFTYTVASGDTLSGIGNKFKISVDAIKYVNNMTDAAVLKVGQELVIPPVSGLIHEVARGDTLQSIANKYDVAPQAIADFNYILDTSSLAVGTELVIPGAKVPQPVYIPTLPTIAPPPANIDPNAGGSWCMWPMPGGIITQNFSWYHNGTDIAESGWLPPLYACAEGTVIRAGWDPFGLGLHVRIDHGNGYETVYGHMSRLDVSYGQHVSKGQVIGIMGSTGRSTGPHVHFMVKYNGVPQDPLNYIHR